MVRGTKKETAPPVLLGPVCRNAIATILTENDRRNAEIRAKFNPITGEGSIGERTKVGISDFPIPMQYLPKPMMSVPLVKQIVNAGSIEAFFYELTDGKLEYTEEEKQKIIEQFVRVRCRFDFPFWAAMYIRILSKTPGEGEILFRLSRPQRRFVELLEKERNAGNPIRFVMLKARQWGGSTTSQLYMAWLQLVHKKGLNSVIIAQTKKTSYVIKDMFDRALKSYPARMLYNLGEDYDDNEQKMENVGLSGDIKRVPQRDCTITIASYEAPDAIRGGAYALVHCSEVGLWEPTEKKSPSSVVQSMAGVPYMPYTMIIYESTAKGTGNFFQKEYAAAKKGESQFKHIFVPWYEIDLYKIPFKSEKEKCEFAERLYENRKSEDVLSYREEPGKYLYYLWEIGATLEAINWYITERKGKDEHAVMASEYPTDDDEAFTFTGNHVFQKQDVEQFRPACKPPKWKGEIYGRADEYEEALENLRFQKEENGRLSVWQDVEKNEEEEVLDRYLVVVDVCKGHTKNADFADILVIDRLCMMDGEPPSVVAEWHGHIDMDKLAWKAAQVAAYYNNALLVIESNTLETNNTKGEAEYILQLVHDVYGDQLYARRQSAEDIRQGLPRKYGFHTNIQTKSVVIHNLKAVIREHLYIEREEECLNEYLTYVETDKGSFEAKEGYHDDRLMTRAIGLQICFHEMDLPRIVNRTAARHQAMSKKPVSAATI